MTTAIYPKTIQNILGSLHDKDSDFDDVWRTLDERDRELTKTLTNGDAYDFILIDEQDAFIFIDNEQTGAWTVENVGQPIYEVEPEMIGDGIIDFDEFMSALEHELGGVVVKKGSALSNAKSTFVEYFKNELDKAFSTALDSF